jgi:hypothetical protein
MYSQEQITEATNRVIREGVLHLLRTQQKSMIGNDCSYSGSGCIFAPSIQEKYRQIVGNPEVYTLLTRGSKFLYPWAVACDVAVAQRLQKFHDEASAEAGKEFLIEVLEAVKWAADNHRYKFPEEGEQYLKQAGRT